MTKNELYELEAEVIKNIDRIKREQAEYVKGVEAGIELMFKAVRNHLSKEAEKASISEAETKREKNCRTCGRQDTGDILCESCVCKYDKTTGKSSDPSCWIPCQPVPEPPKGA